MIYNGFFVFCYPKFRRTVLPREPFGVAAGSSVRGLCLMLRPQLLLGLADTFEQERTDD
jgi:hypothetical protein